MSADEWMAVGLMALFVLGMFLAAAGGSILGWWERGPVTDDLDVDEYRAVRREVRR